MITKIPKHKSFNYKPVFKPFHKIDEPDIDSNKINQWESHASLRSKIQHKWRHPFKRGKQKNIKQLILYLVITFLLVSLYFFMH